MSFYLYKYYKTTTLKVLNYQCIIEIDDVNNTLIRIIELYKLDIYYNIIIMFNNNLIYKSHAGIRFSHYKDLTLIEKLENAKELLNIDNVIIKISD